MRKIKLKDLIKPKKVEIVGDPINQFYSKFIAEPLERGFGLTIGNLLRRTLLSSLEGAAVTAVKFDDVMHEFSTINGVVEDVADVILNLKQLRVHLPEKESASLKLNVKGPCTVLASMLTSDTGELSILSPDLVIATLGEDANLSFEATVRTGRGYSPAERNKDDTSPVGTIFIDSIFSPIRRVNYTVTNARVGRRTDYDRLTLEVWTDGTIDPRTAVAQAAHIISDQLNVFIGENLVVQEEEKIVEQPKAKLNENLFRRIEEIELSVRSANCLENADIKYIGELVQRSEGEMLRTKNFGKKSLSEIKEILGEMSLSLGMKLEGFPSRAQLDRQSESLN
jgi:DNA-directed RNA polymerase subunit alpha